MKIHPLTVGPIVGETTPNRARVWGRGHTDIVDGLPRRCFGVFRYRKSDARDWNPPIKFKMNPNFDMTGIAVINRLTPEERYVFEMGYFFADVELPDVRFAESDWSNASTGQFLTASDDDQEPRNLVIGSCRYLLKTFLGDFFDNRGDKTFRSVLKQIKDRGQDVHQLIMVGDQIYADDLNALNPHKTVDQFYQRYRTAFSQKYIRELMSRVPTYMTLDDHEIEDNWPSQASEKDWKTLFPVAIHAFQSYQLSHSPNIPVRGRKLVGTPEHLWYKYTDGCVDVFVTDSRTERFRSRNFGTEMLSQRQLGALKRWLADGSGRVKLVVTSVPFFPDSTGRDRMDKWFGFQQQRKEILTHVERRQVRKVVFLSGDVHASFSAQLESPKGLKLLSVISSAFFWPYPHPRARHFQTGGTIDGGPAGPFQLTKVSKVIGDDNFTRVRVTPTQLQVDVYGRKGGRAKSSTTWRL